jgi:hypothetical protein
VDAFRQSLWTSEVCSLSIRHLSRADHGLRSANRSTRDLIAIDATGFSTAIVGVFCTSLWTSGLSA